MRIHEKNSSPYISSLSLTWRSDHPDVTALDLGNLALDSKFERRGESVSFSATGKCLSTNKKLHFSSDYSADNSVALEIRQTIGSSFPGVLIGTGTYQKSENRFIIVFNRDKNPIEMWFRWGTGNEPVFRIDMKQEDEKLTKKNVPAKVTFSTHMKFSEDNVTEGKIGYNMTWPGRRTSSGILAGKLDKSQFQLGMRSEDYAIDGFPEKAIANLLLKFGDPDDLSLKMTFDLPSDDLSITLGTGFQRNGDSFEISSRLDNNLFVGPTTVLTTFSYNPEIDEIIISKLALMDASGRQKNTNLKVVYRQDEKLRMDFNSALEMGVKNAFVEFFTKEKKRRKRSVSTESQTTIKFGAKGDSNFNEIFRELAGSFAFKSIMSNESSDVQLAGKIDIDIPAFDLELDPGFNFHMNSANEKFTMNFMVDGEDYMYAYDSQYKNDVFVCTLNFKDTETFLKKEGLKLIIDVPDKSGKFLRNSKEYITVSSKSNYESDLTATFAYEFFILGHDVDTVYILKVTLTLTPTRSACPLRGYWALKSIL